ncbi:unnamed protein product [Auanema sp. JU1783]|nr:unnamed protein product [Auanema sp. JU1783]
MDITVIENAANTILGDPNASNDDRKNAELVFHELQNALTLDLVTHIFSSTKNQFVLFQISKFAGEHVLKQWPLLTSEQIESVNQYLLEYVVNNKDLPTFVTSAILRSVAMIMKRGCLDKKAGTQEKLLEVIRSLLANECPRLQSIGCEFVSALTEQFSSNWRNSEFSITWDFHIKAKTEFEKTGLRFLLEISLETIHTLCSSVEILQNALAYRWCDKFLEVAENIFSWNFSAKFFRRLFSQTQSTTAFRPPGSWGDLIKNAEFLKLFFKLHSLIRTDVTLSARSLSCLAQLAGLSGDVMNEKERGDVFAQSYVNDFVLCFLEVFPDGPSPHEIHGFCNIIQRIIYYRPIHFIMRLPVVGDSGDLRTRFFTYVNKYVIHLTREALHKSIGNCEHEDKDSLCLLYDSWVTLLRGRWRNSLSPAEQEHIENAYFLNPTFDVVQTFLQCTQSAPLGNRATPKDEEHDEDNDDRTLYEGLLSPLGFMAQYTIESFLEVIIPSFRGRVQELQTVMQDPSNTARITQWHDDMHWFMLVLGNSLVIEESDGTCSLPCEVYDYVSEYARRHEIKFDEEVKQKYLCLCVEQPLAERPYDMRQIDPFMMFIGEILGWASIQYQLLLSDGTDHVLSPEVIRSTLMCTRRYINVISRIPEVTVDIDPLCCPFIHSFGPFNEVLVRFCLDMAFIVLKKYRGEEAVCKEAVAFLCSLIESRANALAAEPALFKHMSNIDIASLSSRTILIKALVQIAAGAKDSELQQSMYDLILQPLVERMKYLTSQPSSTEGDSLLTDIIQCFDGVALGGDHESGQILAKILHPLLKQCVPLMTSRSHCAPLISAILQLLLDTTIRVSIYVDDKEEEAVLYESLFEITQAYCQGQLHRFADLKNAEDDQANDLIVFLDILMNVISKDLLMENDSIGCKVSIMTLEVLLNTMNDQMLMIPDLAQKFFRYICYLVQFNPEALKGSSEYFLMAIYNILKTGLTSNYGHEVTSLSMEGIFALSQFICTDHESALPLNFKESVNNLLPTVFELCLEFSGETALFTDAANALFGLISINRPYYEAFVRNLLSSKKNEAAVTQLSEAFSKLLPADVDFVARRSKIEFRKRMEVFLTDIQGLLVTN